MQHISTANRHTSPLAPVRTHSRISSSFTFRNPSLPPYRTQCPNTRVIRIAIPDRRYVTRLSPYRREALVLPAFISADSSKAGVGPLCRCCSFSALCCCYVRSVFRVRGRFRLLGNDNVSQCDSQRKGNASPWATDHLKPSRTRATAGFSWSGDRERS